MNVSSCIYELLYTKRHALFSFSAIRLYLQSYTTNSRDFTRRICYTILYENIVGQELSGADSLLFEYIAVMA
jgi:hypothetical protein